MAKFKDLGNDSNPKDSREDTNSTSVVSNLRGLHKFGCMSTKLKSLNKFNFETTISWIKPFVNIVMNIVIS
jgi:hypothetical protein